MTAKLKYSLLSIIFILGYTSLSFELIMLKQMVNFVGSNTLITSIVIAFILLFLSVGYYLGSVVSFAEHPIRKTIRKLINFLSVWYILACSYYIIGIFFYSIYLMGVSNVTAQVFVLSALFLILPSVGLGFVTAVLGRIIHHFNSDYTGRFMAIDTIGSVMGSLLTTLLLMPLLGVYAAITMIVFLTSSLLLITARKQDRQVNVVSCLCLTMAALVVSGEKLPNVNNNVVLDNAIARVEISAADFENGNPQSEIMMINGSYSSKFSKKEHLMFEYVKYINNQYINNLSANRVHNILILGAGGFTIGKDDYNNNYTYLDIIKELPKITQEKFGFAPLTEKKKFIAEDAYLFLLKSKAKYDVIVVDVYSAMHSIPSGFVTSDFFNMVKKHLSADGVAIFNIITSPSFKTKFAKRVDNTLRLVFTHSLSRQVVTNETFNPYSDALANVIYTFYNSKEDNTVYTVDKNSAVWGQ